MPDPCPVTVRAGPQLPKGYQDFVSGSLQEDRLQEITGNLDKQLKAEALGTFLDSVKDGLSIAQCIDRVQKISLIKVPNERNKFFIKFVYDNQLQIEIGVNKFKNGNAQFYHKLGVQPRATQEDTEKKVVWSRRREAMQQIPDQATRLKRQVTNDRSAPLVSVEQWVTVRLPPNPTNAQTARDRQGRAQQDVGPASNTRLTSRPQALGRVFRAQPPSTAGLRSRSLGRPLQERQEKQESDEWRDRSVSPQLGARGVPRRGLGDCFRGGVTPSQVKLRPASPSPARKVSTGTFGLEKDKTHEVLKHVKIGQEEEVRPLEQKVRPNAGLNPMKTIKIVIQAKDNKASQGRQQQGAEQEASRNTAQESPQEVLQEPSMGVSQGAFPGVRSWSPASSSSSSTSRSSSSSSIAEEWRENCLEIEEIPETPPLTPTEQGGQMSPSPKVSEDDSASRPSFEFLQPSTIFLTESSEGQVEEPLEERQEQEQQQQYPIQNFRNRNQDNKPESGKYFVNTAFSPERATAVMKPSTTESQPISQPVGPFFSQPFSPIQVRRWKDRMDPKDLSIQTGGQAVKAMEETDPVQRTRQQAGQQIGQTIEQKEPKEKLSGHPKGKLGGQVKGQEEGEDPKSQAAGKKAGLGICQPPGVQYTGPGVSRVAGLSGVSGASGVSGVAGVEHTEPHFRLVERTVTEDRAGWVSIPIQRL